MREHLARLRELAETHPDNPDIHLQLAEALFNAALHEGGAGELEKIHERLNRLGELTEAHPDHHGMNENASVAHVYALNACVDDEAFETAGEIIEELAGLAATVDQFRFGERGTAAQNLIEQTTQKLLEADRIELLERYRDALEAGLSDSRWSSICIALVMDADELLRDGEIPMETYTRVAERCTD